MPRSRHPFAGPVLAAALCLAASLGAARASAQQAPAREYEVLAQRLREQVEALKTQRLLLDASSARVDVDSVLRALGPQLERARIEAARAQSQLASRFGAQLTTDADLNRLSRELGQVQGLAQLELSQRSRRLRSDAPTGYLGVSYSSSIRTVSRNGDVVVYHDDAPVVVSVEPGSPAERAGIRRGDTLVSYDGLVLRKRAVSLADVLKPGRTVAVGLRRGGEARTVNVVVGRRPQAYVVGPQEGTRLSYAVIGDPVAPFTVYSVPSPATPAAVGQGGSRGMVSVAPTPPFTVAAPFPALAPVAPPTGTRLTPAAAPTPPPTTWVFGGTSIVVAGAQVVPLDDSWRELLGADDDGVVVVKVAAGTPASAAGLRSGDVITSADGNPVLTPAAFQRALQGSTDRSVSLGVLRKRQTRTVELKW